MTGSEAGLNRPPLQPILLGRISARFPRATFPPTSFQTLAEMSSITPRPRFDDAALRAGAYEELTRKRNSFPQEETFDNQRLSNLFIGGYNSAKARRIEQIIGDGIRVGRVPEAQESHELDVVADAYSKARSAAHILETREDLRREVRMQESVTTAVDVLTALPIKNDGHLIYQRFGKPQSDEEIYQRFVALNEMVQQEGLTSYPYIVESATVILNPFYPNRDAVSVQQAVVFLSPQLLSTLATPEGFAQYKALAEASLKKLHADGTTTKDKTLLDVSAGFVIEGFRGMLNGHGIQRIITDPDELLFLHPKQEFDEQAYAQAKSIARGHADENLIVDYTRRFTNNPLATRFAN